MDRQLISSGSPWEPVGGYSRAVRVGNQVFVSGTAPVMPDGADPPPDAYAQARHCLDIIISALAEAGARPEHVVRTRIYGTNEDDFDAIARAHREVFADIRPACTWVVVSAIVDPEFLVEIEADAVIG